MLPVGQVVVEAVRVGRGRDGRRVAHEAELPEAGKSRGEAEAEAAQGAHAVVV